MFKVHSYKLLLIIICSLSTSFSLTRPASPTIANVIFTGSSIKVTVTGVPANADSCHAVLLTDLTTGFDAAYAVGNCQLPSGTVLTYAAKAPLTELTIDLDSNFRERYYIAVASSRAGQDSARIFSPWKVYGDANGLPRAISTSYGNKTENVLYRARKIGELSDNLIVVDITFSLKYADTTGSKFKLFHNTTPIVNFTSLGNISNSKKSIKDAIDNFTSLDSQLVIKRDTLGFSEYTIYRMVKINNGDSLKSEIIKPDGTVIDTANRKIFIIEDAAHRDIIKTISNLCRMPSGTPDPVYPPATIPPNADTNKVKLLTTAMLDLTVAHNSPQGEKNEEQQGIFTNYMQLFDDVVRNWGTVGTSVPGMARLQAIFSRVLTVNKGAINEPVSIINNGTCFDIQSNPKRKNYAFCDGYTKLNWNLQKPDYGTTSAGVGVMFRTDRSITLTGAWYSGGKVDFDTVPFTNGTTARRMIYRANNARLNRLGNDTGGVWLQGIEGCNPETFYTGVLPVRLPIKTTSGGIVKIDTSFSLPTEVKTKGDIEGKIVGGAGKSILKISAINASGTGTDTLQEIREPGMLLHRQKRKLTFNKDYMLGTSLKYQVQTEESQDSNKVYVERRLDSYSAILADTSVTVGSWTALAITMFNNLPVSCVGVKGTTRKIGLKDAENGVQEVWCDGVVGIAMETNSDNWVEPEKRTEMEIVLRGDSGGVKIYTTREKTTQIFPPDKNSTLNAEKDGDAYTVPWDRFIAVFLSQDSVFASIEQGKYGELSIVARQKLTLQEETNEALKVKGVPKILSIEFVSDHEDAEGNNIVRDENTSFLAHGNIVNGPEWINGIVKPISQTMATFLKIEMKIMFPCKGTMFEIEGVGDDSSLSFSKYVVNSKAGLNIFQLRAKTVLPALVQKKEGIINWKIREINGDTPQFSLQIPSDHRIYVTFDKPFSNTSGQQPLIISEKRIDWAIKALSSLDSINKAPKVMRTYIERELSKFFDQPSVLFGQVWIILENREKYPYPTIPPANVQGGKCGEMALLMELLLRMVGVEAQYVHTMPSKDSIRISTLSNPTFRVEIEKNPPHPECRVTNLIRETLRFYFEGYGSWQFGEGSVYYGTKIYPMFAREIIAEGITNKIAARNLMIALQNENMEEITPSSDYKLQRWLLLLTDGFERCRRGEVVEIPAY